jgi:hypothetical protein
VISEMTPPPHSLPEMADERSKTAPGVPCPARRGEMEFSRQRRNGT